MPFLQSRTVLEKEVAHGLGLYTDGTDHIWRSGDDHFFWNIPGDVRNQHPLQVWNTSVDNCCISANHSFGITAGLILFIWSRNETRRAIGNAKAFTQ